MQEETPHDSAEVITLLIKLIDGKLKTNFKEQKKIINTESVRYQVLEMYKRDMQEFKMLLTQQLNVFKEQDAGRPTLSLGDTLLYKKVNSLISMPKLPKRNEKSVKTRLLNQAKRERRERFE